MAECVAVQSSVEEVVKQSWFDLCEKLGVNVTLSQKWWKIICDNYSEPTRYYHTLSHLSDMLRHLDTTAKKLSNAEEVSMAIFFHELVNK